ncbi:hypothetical protein J6590_064768 [Homalodisca vitripennis]|nr:hypothetical protein J6590_064768 [Homalodisca vitripennis]
MENSGPKWRYICIRASNGQDEITGQGPELPYHKLRRNVRQTTTILVKLSLSSLVLTGSRSKEAKQTRSKQEANFR